MKPVDQPPPDSLLWGDGQAMLAFLLLTNIYNLDPTMLPLHTYNWLAMDEDGAWWTYTNKPVFEMATWVASGLIAPVGVTEQSPTLAHKTLMEINKEK